MLGRFTECTASPISPLSTMAAKTGECRAKSKDEDGLECDCTLYEEDTEQSGYCSTCYHREKAHLLSTPGATVPKLHVRSLLAGMMDGTKLGSKLFTSSSSASSSRKKIVPSLSAANRESNQGMRPPKAGSSKVKVIIPLTWLFIIVEHPPAGQEKRDQRFDHV